MVASEFMTSEGIVIPAVTAAQMAEVDRLAIEETGPNLFQMMEHAGFNLALTAIELLGAGWQAARIVVLVGNGGNGGGGICAARHLVNRGARVVVIPADEGRLGKVPAQQLRTYRSAKGETAAVAQLTRLHPDLVVDAVIGYSLHGPPRGTAEAMIRWAGTAGAPVLSLDVPSGLDATTGEAPGACVRAAATMTLALPKQGLDASGVGLLTLADIGVPPPVFEAAGVAIPPNIFGARARVPLVPC